MFNIHLDHNSPIYKLEAMPDKHELTEKLKVVEKQIYNHKTELRAINAKLENAYKYEDELLQRLNFARKETAEFRNQFFAKSTEISQQYEKMKNIFDVFTMNYYNP